MGAAGHQPGGRLREPAASIMYPFAMYLRTALGLFGQRPWPLASILADDRRERPWQGARPVAGTRAARCQIWASGGAAGAAGRKSGDLSLRMFGVRAVAGERGPRGEPARFCFSSHLVLLPHLPSSHPRLPSPL
ncbi:hypothetical protein C8Q78DRAFT_796625 [Trametes maxima]|nr:hypothetical protein C8Q78DRAFT_796625 [Trametes maxima]